MKGFLAGVGAANVLFALTSFAYWSGHAAAAAPPNRQQVGSIKLADLPLNRSFQVALPSTAFSPIPGQSAFEITLPFPPTSGIAISQAVNFAGSSGQIIVDGVPVARFDGTEFDPPILVRPGSTLTIICSTFGNNPPSLRLGGWTLGLGDV